jgi:small nuclear ribonucleoprotein (snRNP)-like protein
MKPKRVSKRDKIRKWRFRFNLLERSKHPIPMASLEEQIAQADPTSTLTDAASYLASLLDQPLRVTTPDKRSFIGRLRCVDRGCNIILVDAEEFLPLPETEEELMRRLKWDEYWPKSERYSGEGEGWGGRQVGMVMIKGSDCVKIELVEPGLKRESFVFQALKSFTC